MGLASAIVRTFRGIIAALRSRPWVALGVAAAVVAFNLLVPVLLLSLLRRPADFFTFNPWLRRLTVYLTSPVPLIEKLSFLGHLSIAWVSADGPNDGIEWGFIVDVPTLARIFVTAALFGTYFALWSRAKARTARPAGIVGAVGSVFGLTTCPCTLAGCGAPVLPVLGLAFTGLPVGTLALFGVLSRVGMTVVLAALVVGIAWLGWRAGGQTEGASVGVPTPQ